MKTIYLFISLSVIALQACSQSPSNTTPKNPSTTPAPVTEKPKAPVYKSAKEGWLVDLDEAYALSVKEGKPIMANFTGSDWCGWCKKLDAAVFTKPEFKEWAKKHVVLLELDFPRRFQIPQKNQSQNAAMRNALGITGFPTVWIVDLTKDNTNGQYQVKGLGRTGYKPSVEEFIASVDPFVK